MNRDETVDTLAEECEAARLAVGTIINKNRIDPDMTEIDAALAKWRRAKKALWAAEAVSKDGRASATTPPEDSGATS